MALFNEADFAGARITRMALHEVGPRAEHFRLHEGLVAPGDSEPFFVDRVQAANNGSAYTFEAASDVLGSLRTVADDASFVEVGKSLARAFHAKHTGQSSAGTLAVMEITLGDPTAAAWAILKFDHRRGVLPEYTNDVARVTFLRKTLNDEKNAMQKAAVISLDASGGKLSVINRRTPGDVPVYFEEFLGVTRVTTTTDMTKALVKVFEDVTMANADFMGDKLVSAVPTHLYDAAQGADTFDFEDDTLLTSVFGAQAPDSPIRASFAARIADAGLTGETFELDKSAVPKPTRIRYDTSENIYVSIPIEFKDVVRIDKESVPGKTLIIIETAGYTIHAESSGSRPRSR
jgi:hypothetical protein